MQTRIQKIGDGLGLVLPKELLETCGFGGKATVTVRDKTLVVSPEPRQSREGWAEALAAIPQVELDRDFDELRSFREAPCEWGVSDWQWPDTSTDEKV